MSLNVGLLRSSFENVKPIANEVSLKFYEFLFTDYPEAQALFENVNMEKQRKALIAGLVTIVDNLENPEKLTDYLKKMGGRHVKYNTEDEHYPLVGNTLIKTFAYFFQDNWTEELQEAWLGAYQAISSLMIEGAHEYKIELKKKMDPREKVKNMFSQIVDEELENAFDDIIIHKIRAKIKNQILKIFDEECENILKKSA